MVTFESGKAFAFLRGGLCGVDACIGVGVGVGVGGVGVGLGLT